MLSLKACTALQRLSARASQVRGFAISEERTMRWQKLGWIFCAACEYPWMTTHAANPVAEWRHGDVFRIYFSSRDADRRAHIGYVDIDIKEPQTILAVSEKPVISPGEIGAFDDSGTSMGCIVRHKGRRHLYYLGWN